MKAANSSVSETALFSLKVSLLLNCYSPLPIIGSYGLSAKQLTPGKELISLVAFQNNLLISFHLFARTIHSVSLLVQGPVKSISNSLWSFLYCYFLPLGNKQVNECLVIN